MNVRHFPASCGSQANTAILMLPGALQQPSDFMDAGFTTAIHGRNLAIDLHVASFGSDVIADVTSTASLQQIDAFLVQPAKAANYSTIWLAGISMGALMALAYADYRPRQVQRLCLFSPYPGNRLLQREIADAGGLAAWHPSDDENLDAEQRMWRRIQSPWIDGPMHLAYGSDDRFADGLQQMTQALPAATLDIVPGGHDWPTWSKLWSNFLDHNFAVAKVQV